MGLRCPIKEHIKKDMMVHANAPRWNLEIDHLLPDELFKWEKTHMG
jgi:hypothetical protein